MQSQSGFENTKHLNPPPDVRDVLEHFVASSKTFDASADELVRVCVNAMLVVTDLKITDATLDCELRQRIEAAAIAAVNSALRKAVLAAGTALTEIAPTPSKSPAVTAD
jgi:DNA-binding protein YbaB